MEGIKKALDNIKVIDKGMMQEAEERLNCLTKPKGSLGRLEDLAKLIVGIKREMKPSLEKKVIFTLAGDHGIAREGVSLFPQEVTKQMVENFLKGGAGINVLARHVGARVVVVDMGVASDLAPHPNLIVKKVNYGTRNIAQTAAMTREEATRAIQGGIDVVESQLAEGIDIIGTGDMGIGNTTSSSAIVSAITGLSPEQVTGRGTGIDDARLRWKINLIKHALEINRPDTTDPIDVLAKVGGFEIGGLVGVIIGAAAHGIPVVIDGFISGTAALLAVSIDERVKDYLIPAHCSTEPGHRIILDFLQMVPLLDLNLRLGEGTGAALAMSIIDASIKIIKEMKTFTEAGVASGL